MQVFDCIDCLGFGAAVRPGSLGQRSPQAPLDLVRGSVPLRIGVEEVGSFRFCFCLRNSAMKLVEYFGTVPSKERLRSLLTFDNPALRILNISYCANLTDISSLNAISIHIIAEDEISLGE
jgi:hypothetical protein